MRIYYNYHYHHHHYDHHHHHHHHLHHHHHHHHHHHYLWVLLFIGVFFCFFFLLSSSSSSSIKFRPQYRSSLTEPKAASDFYSRCQSVAPAAISTKSLHKGGTTGHVHCEWQNRFDGLLHMSCEVVRFGYGIVKSPFHQANWKETSG